MKRYSRIAYLREGTEIIYDRYHRQVWPEVISFLRQFKVKTYSIFRYQRTLFSYMELYEGTSLEKFVMFWMKNPICCRWEKIMQTLQQPISNGKNPTHWIPMKEVFHIENIKTCSKKREKKK